MPAKTIHVVPHKERWAVKRGGQEQVVSFHETQKDAEKSARKLSRAEEAELVIHGKDGTIKRKDSHGNDPRNIKG